MNAMLLRHSAIYIVSKAAPALITVSMLAVFSRILTPLEYGFVAWTLSVVMVAFNFTTSWLCAVVVRFDAAERHSSFAGTIFSMFLVIMVVIGVATFAAHRFFGGEDVYRYIMLGFFMLALMGWTEINLAFLMARLRAGFYGLLNVLRALASAMLGGLLAYLGWGATGALTGMVLGLLIPSLWLLAANWRDLSFQLSDRRMMRNICAYGLPLAAGSTLYALAANVDRQLLIALEGASVLGLYAIGCDLAYRTVAALMSPIGTAGLPLAVEALEREGKPAAARQLSANCVLLVAVGLPSTAGLALLAPEISNLVLGEEFRDAAARILPVCACGAFLSGLRSFYVDHAFQLGRQTAKLPIIMLAMAVISVALNCLLIPPFGMLGAAYALLGAHAGGVLVGLFLARHAFQLPIPMIELGKLAACAAIMCLTILSIEPGPGQGGVALAAQVVIGATVYGASCIAFDVRGIRRAITWRVEQVLRARQG